jgi:hypothetical protein
VITQCQSNITEFLFGGRESFERKVGRKDRQNFEKLRASMKSRRISMYICIPDREQRTAFLKKRFCHSGNDYEITDPIYEERASRANSLLIIQPSPGDASFLYSTVDNAVLRGE